MAKLRLEELVVDKYYHCYAIRDNHQYYFKFNKLVGENIYCYEFSIIKNVYVNNYVFNKCPDFFCNSSWYINDCDFLEEINIKEIIDYLPDNHIEKKAYYRTKKINSLLGE